ncbi:NAD-dependent succinate-semialdehyde dehydrogenase [Candidatus Sumerlaeota bacterium]|nr:NAD-dependent succinate-semialdehyde dehydrogenase [Candidatus Sumerlaeota bacterium]
MRFRSINPATGELLKSYPPATGKEIESALAGAEKAHAGFRALALAQRTKWLENAAAILETKAPDYARLMAREMGKPVTQGEAEARKCALACRHAAESAELFLRNEKHSTAAGESFVTHEPIGTILAIMPWNFPFWQFFRFAASTLALGNTILLKHAPSTPQCSLAIHELMLEAGFPHGVVQSIFLTNFNAAKVLQDYRIHGVTLTGSSEAGSKVAAIAGRNLKRMALELGGSDPFIVLDDANLKLAASVAAQARCQNSGQSCIAAKRFLVHRAVLEQFTEFFTVEMTAMKVGDPTDHDTQIGPLARADLRKNLQQQVKESIASGCVVLATGTVPQGRGFYYPPTVLGNVTPNAPAWKDELFGPVAALVPFEDDADAVRIANDTSYGLGASIWTENINRARRMIPQIECGTLFINEMVKSDPALPFGGTKKSGFGREMARDGMLEFANCKSVWIK